MILYTLLVKIVESARVNCRKPEGKIYKIMLETLGIKPEEAVFLDDFRGNVEAARAIGLRAIKVNIILEVFLNWEVNKEIIHVCWKSRDREIKAITRRW